MRTMIIGANGQLGSDVLKVFGEDHFYNLIAVNREEVDIANKDTIHASIVKYRPEIIISTAAFHRVDICETEPEKSFSVNSFGVRNLCLECLENDITLVHFSTDYVFGQDKTRTKPYLESDAPGPVNLYGISKLSGEYFIRYLLKKFFVIRTCGLYGISGPVAKGDNFVDSMVKKSKLDKSIKVINDQICTPTSTLDLARNLKELLKTSYFGLYHITNEGQCSWYDFSLEIMNLLKASTVIEPTSSKDFYSKVERPKYSVLENHNLNKYGLNSMKTWKDALKEYLKLKWLLK